MSRVSSTTTARPVPPYSTTFNTQFGSPFTFVGTLDATVVNEQGERFRLMMSDLANEVVVLDRFFVSTNPIHAYFVDAQGKIRDRASLVGRVIVDTKTGHSLHYVDRPRHLPSAGGAARLRCDRSGGVRTVLRPAVRHDRDRRLGARTPAGPRMCVGQQFMIRQW